MKKKINESWKKLITDSSLRSKLVWIYFLLIILPLGLFSFYAIRRVNTLVKEQTLSSVQKAFDNTFTSVQEELNRLIGVLDILSTDPIVYRVASYEPAAGSYTQRLEDSTQLSTTIEHLQSLSGVSRIRLYVKNDYLYANQQHNIIPASEAAGSQWYERLDGSQSFAWYYPGDYADQPDSQQDLFSAVRVVYSPSNIKQPLAVMRADIESMRLERLISLPETPGSGMFFLLKDNEMLLVSDNGFPRETVISCLSQYASDTAEEWQILDLEGQDCYVLCRSLLPDHWKMAVLLPHHDVFRLSRALRVEMLLVVCAVGLLSYVVALSISRSTLTRLSRLAQTMRDVEQGDVTARITPEGKDEIGRLMGSFSQMMDRIDGLMEEKVAYGREIKNLELKALQAQINPHFLYNSLDLISCTAIVHNVPEITRMVGALARFYKLSLNRGKEVISIENEILHARLYVEIQNLRFEDRIHVEWNIDERIREYQIIKIVLQPIIENAIIHGIFETSGKTGSISVEGGFFQGGIRIVVRDNGIGMDEATLHENFDPTPPGGIVGTKGGYGIRNINDRLRLAYGEPYGLSCESRPGSGTAVSVYIPAVLQDSDSAGSSSHTSH